MDGSETFGVVGGEQVQGLLVAVPGRLEVTQEHRPGLADVAGLLERLVGGVSQCDE